MKALDTLRQTPLVVMAYVRLRNLAAAFRFSFKFLGHLFRYKMRFGNPRGFRMKWQWLYPCLSDDTGTTGFDRHYTFHTAWAARVVSATRPDEHHDISSAVYFSTIVSAFVPVHFYDYRPATLRLPNLTSGSADLNELPFATASLRSLSCMHVVEHIGLGRYGDPLDPEGDLKAICELKRVVRPGGQLLFVVPIGGEAKIMFNAHRIYTADMVKSYFSDAFDLETFALIPDRPEDGDLVTDPSRELLARQFYGCGCFHFVKRSERIAR